MRIAMTVLAATLVSQVCFGWQGGFGVPSTQTLYPPDGSYGWFGQYIDVDGDRLIVGSGSHLAQGIPNVIGHNVCIFERDGLTWSQTDLLMPPIVGSQFGAALDLKGDRALVGAPLAGPGGGMYLYERDLNGWALVETFSVPAGFIGTELALQDDYIFAINLSAGGNAISVFRETPSGWSLQATIIPSDGPTLGAYGSQLVATENELFLGDPLATTVSSEDGAIYVFELQGGNWVETQKILPNVSLQHEHFGSQLDVEGDVLVASSDHNSANSCNRVFIFDRGPSGWTQSTQLIPIDGPVQSDFGTRLDIRGDRIVAGAPYHPDGGKAYVFERREGTWTPLALLEPANPDISEWAGVGVGLDEYGSVLVGMAIDSTAPGESSGSVIYYDVTRGVRYCAATPNSTGTAARIDVQGSLSVVANDLRVRVGPIPPQQPGILYYGMGQTQIPFGDGFRCISAIGGVYRIFPFVTPEDFGFYTRELDLTALPMSSGPGQILPGSTWNLQSWYRDPAASGAGFNLSDAIEMAFLP